MKYNNLIYLAAAISIVALAGLSCASQAAPQPNRPPMISGITGATDWSPNVEDEFICNASDPDGDTLTYRWSADDGTITGAGERITWRSPSAMGKYQITVTVTDSKGLEATMAKDVRVNINADGSTTPDAPVVLNLKVPAKDPVTASKRVRIWTSSTVECRVEGNDVKKLKYTWTPSNGKLQAEGLAEGTASSVTWIAPGAGGEYTLDVVVTDESGNEAKGTVKFDVFCCGNY